jgi:hypothetical protein
MRFVSEIQLRDVIQILLVAGGILVWGLRTEGRIDIVAKDVSILQRDTLDLKSDIREDLSEIKQAIDRLTEKTRNGSFILPPLERRADEPPGKPPS